MIVALGASIFLLVLISVLFLAVYLGITVDTEADAALFEGARGSRTTRLYYNAERGGAVYRAVEWESERLYANESAIFTAYSEMPERLKNAFIAAEDHRFFKHIGIDLYRTAKAASNHLFRLGGHFGGSSITQQLVKNLTGDSEQTVVRKLREMWRALALERR